MTRLTAKTKDGKRQTSLIDFINNPSNRVPTDDIIPYGNTLDNKANGIWRIGFQNVHGTHLNPNLQGMEETDSMFSL